MGAQENVPACNHKMIGTFSFAGGGRQLGLSPGEMKNTCADCHADLPLEAPYHAPLPERAHCPKCGSLRRDYSREITESLLGATRSYYQRHPKAILINIGAGVAAAILGFFLNPIAGVGLGIVTSIAFTFLLPPTATKVEQLMFCCAGEVAPRLGAFPSTPGGALTDWPFDVPHGSVSVPRSTAIIAGTERQIQL